MKPVQEESLVELLLKLPPGKQTGIRNLLSSDAARPKRLRANLNELWPEFRDLADRDFVARFGIEPNQRAWEMHVAVALRRKNIELTAPTPGHGPDFLAHDGKSKVWIEAVTAHPGEENDQVPTTTGPCLVFGQGEEDRIALRLTNALSQKAEKLKKYIEAGLIEDRDRYVIALCSAIPHHLVNGYHVARAIFGIGGWEIERDLDLDTREPVGGYLRRQDLIHKATGAGVPTDGFLTKAWERVSAVIFNCGAFPVSTSPLGKEFVTVHNFAAVNPLRWGWLRFHVDYRVTEKDGQKFLTRVYPSSGFRLPGRQGQ